MRLFPARHWSALVRHIPAGPIILAIRQVGVATASRLRFPMSASFCASGYRGRSAGWGFEISHAEPEVRIHLPLAVSQVRTGPHRFGDLPPASHAPAPPIAVLTRARQLPCATRPKVWRPRTPEGHPAALFRGARWQRTKIDCTSLTARVSSPPGSPTRRPNPVIEPEPTRMCYSRHSSDEQVQRVDHRMDHTRAYRGVHRQ